MVKDNLDGAFTFNNNDIFTFPYVVNFTDDSRPARFIDVGHLELKSYFYKSELCFGSEYLYFPFHVCINRDFTSRFVANDFKANGFHRFDRNEFNVKKFGSKRQRRIEREEGRIAVAKR